MTANYKEIDNHIAWAEREQAKGEKGQWDQGNWGITKPSCGTAFCIAGHAAAMAGFKPASISKTTDPSYFSRKDQKFAFIQEWEQVIPPNVKRAELNRDEHYGGFDDDRVQSTDVVGAELLGLGDLRYMTGYDLFDGSNDIRALKRIRDLYAREEGVEQAYTDEEKGW